MIMDIRTHSDQDLSPPQRCCIKEDKNENIFSVIAFLLYHQLGLPRFIHGEEHKNEFYVFYLQRV